MDKGFTLLEMLLSLFVVITIVWLITYNIYRVNSQSQLSEATHIVAMYLEGAKNCSIATAKETEVSLSQVGINSSCQIVQNQYQFEDVELTTNFSNNIVTFNERGNALKGGTITICNHIGCKYVTVGVGNSDIRIK